MTHLKGRPAGKYHVPIDFGAIGSGLSAAIARSLFNQGTFTARRAEGRDAPIPIVRGPVSEPTSPAVSGH